MSRLFFVTQLRMDTSWQVHWAGGRAPASHDLVGLGEAEALVATGMNDGEKAAEDPAHEAASVAQGDAPPGVGATTQLLCGAGEGEWLFAVEPSLLAELEATRVAHVHA
jgi:hypothetical protein